ncbi:MAG: hypothetical protein ACI4UA_06325, partial [Bacteroidaceae bacterium]
QHQTNQMTTYGKKEKHPLRTDADVCSIQSFTHANAHEIELREVNPNDCVDMHPYMWRETVSFMLTEPQALQQIRLMI